MRRKCKRFRRCLSGRAPRWIRTIDGVRVTTTQALGGGAAQLPSRFDNRSPVHPSDGTEATFHLRLHQALAVEVADKNDRRVGSACWKETVPCGDPHPRLLRRAVQLGVDAANRRQGDRPLVRALPHDDRARPKLNRHALEGKIGRALKASPYDANDENTGLQAPRRRGPRSSTRAATVRPMRLRRASAGTIRTP